MYINSDGAIICLWIIIVAKVCRGGGGLGAKECVESGKSSKLLIKGDVMPSLLDIAPNVPISGGIQVEEKSLVTVRANPNPVYQMGIHVMAQ